MAGVFPLPVQTSGRKQWTLYNGPSRGIQRLGSQLAEDGCPESQVLLAKQLLYEKCDSEIDQEENAKYGVYWLIKASEQGHEEATQILSHCLETGKGISEHNFLDVKSCLDMSQEEKLARTAARKLFESMSGGESFITSKQLQNKILQLEEPSTSQEDSNCQDWKNRNDSGEKLSVDMLISAASTYSRGEMPIIQAVLCIDAAPPMRRHRLLQATLQPVLSVCVLYQHLLDSVSRYSWRSWLPNLFTQLQIAFWVGFYITFGFDTAIGLIPIVIYYGSFAFMVIATFQILMKKRDSYHFRKWSQLFIAYSSSSNLNTQEAEFQHCCNNLKPYVLFFSALLLHLLSLPSVPEYIIPYSELTIIAYIFTFLTVYNFAVKDISKERSSLDWLALFSFAVHVLAKYPYETDTVVSQSWRFIDVHVPTFASYVVGNGVEFCLNFRALFYLVIPAVLIKMASRNNYRGIYTTLIPHCVALAWWQMAIITSEGATWYGLIRSALAMVGMVLFLPLAGLGTILLPAVAAGKYLAGSDDFVRIAMTAGCASLPIIAVFFLGKIRPLGTFGTLLGWIQVMMAVVAGTLLVWPVLHYDEANYKMDAFQTSLTYAQFREFCTDQKHELNIEVISQLNCVQLVGSPVRWEGKVTAARLIGVYNPVMNIIQRLPTALKNVVTCVVGEKNNDGKFKKSIQNGSPHQRLFPDCHLNSWNRYEFEVDVTMSTSLGLWLGADVSVTLSADHSFKNFTSALTIGDHIWFTGYLRGSASGVIDVTQPRINLFEVGCLKCRDKGLIPAMKVQNEIFFFGLRDLYNGVKSVLNFFFNPLVIFR